MTKYYHPGQVFEVASTVGRVGDAILAALGDDSYALVMLSTGETLTGVKQLSEQDGTLARTFKAPNGRWRRSVSHEGMGVLVGSDQPAIEHSWRRLPYNVQELLARMA